MREQPKWQKAKLIVRPPVYPHIYGKFFWIKNEGPHLLLGINWKGGLEQIEGFISNLKGWDRPCLIFSRSSLELQNEFADDIPLIPFAEWSCPDWEGVDPDSKKEKV